MQSGGSGELLFTSMGSSMESERHAERVVRELANLEIHAVFGKTLAQCTSTTKPGDSPCVLERLGTFPRSLKISPLPNRSCDDPQGSGQLT